MISASIGFDSKLVRLKGQNLALLMMQDERFDSKLVRLKVHWYWQRSYCLCEFRFQTGSIKSQTLGDRYDLGISVSIPNWFD